MKETQGKDDDRVSRLIRVTNDKLEANRAMIAKSLGHGKLSWRFDPKKDNFKVNLELKLGVTPI